MKQQSLEERQAYVAAEVAKREARKSAQPASLSLEAEEGKRTRREIALENLRLANQYLKSKRGLWAKPLTNAERCARYRIKKRKARKAQQ